MARGTRSSLPVESVAMDVSKMGRVETAGDRTETAGPGVEAGGAGVEETRKQEREEPTTTAATYIRTCPTPTPSATPSATVRRSRISSSSLSNSSLSNSNSNFMDRRRSSQATVGGAGAVGLSRDLTVATEDSISTGMQLPLVRHSRRGGLRTGIKCDACV